MLTAAKFWQVLIFLLFAAIFMQLIDAEIGVGAIGETH